LSLAAASILTCGVSANPSGEPAFAEDSTASTKRIVATYHVDLGNFNLGDFRLTTVLRGSDYEMRGEGRFSLLGGLLYDWHATTASKGRVTGMGPEPATYAVTYDGGNESQQFRVIFDGGAVTKVSMAPISKPSPHVIPITKEQLEGVLDPVTAIFLYARSENPNGDLKVCDHTVPVFDGEQRFDLVLKPKRTAKLQKDASTGYSGFAAVCRVKFNPISGYRPDDPDIRLMSQTNEIEVWLVSLPGTAMYVPYRIVLPTLAGYASATSSSFKILSPHTEGRRAGPVTLCSITCRKKIWVSHRPRAASTTRLPRQSAFACASGRQASPPWSEPGGEVAAGGPVLAKP
jgi:hypothetical protein